MRIGNKELVDPIVFFGLRGLFAPASATLSAVFGQRLALDVARVTERDHHVGGRDQVLGAEFLHVALDHAAPLRELALAELGAQRGEFLGDDRRHARLGDRRDQATRRSATAAEIGSMRTLVLEAMAAGAVPVVPARLTTRLEESPAPV